MSTQDSPLNNERLPNDNEPKTFKDAVRLLQKEAMAKGLDRLTMEEIDAEITAYRREQKEKELAGQ